MLPIPGTANIAHLVENMAVAKIQLSPEELWKLTVEATAGWHPTVREFFAHADPETFFPITIRAAERLFQTLL